MPLPVTPPAASQDELRPSRYWEAEPHTQRLDLSHLRVDRGLLKAGARQTIYHWEIEIPFFIFMILQCLII